MKESIKTANDLNDLNKALLNAVNSAAMLDGADDCGTCNFDSVVLKISIPAKLAAQAGVKLDKMLASDYGRMWKGCYMVDIPLSGQASRRTRMAKAACNALNAAGYNALMFYQCD